MRITGSALLETVGQLLLDTGEAIWGSTFKVKAVNEALNLIALVRPDATATTETVSLTASTPKQSIPAAGIRFIDILMNTSGAPVRKISREVLSETVPGWTTETGSAIEHYMFDEENPKVFYVYPVPSSAINVELVYSAIPDEFTAETTSMPLDDVYQSPIIEYCLYRCLDMEGEGQDLAKASIHLSAFFNMLGIKTQSDSLLKQVQEG